MKPQSESCTGRIRQDDLIARAYGEMLERVRGYIRKRIGPTSDVEDLAEEVFVQLLEYHTLLTEQTLPRFIYTVARNRIVDYLRRHARSRRAQEYFTLRAPRATHETEERIAANELERLENRCLGLMAPRKAEIYRLHIHDGRSVEEISAALALSRRTVENQIFRARCEAREALRAAL